MGFYFGKNNLRARTRKLVFGVRRLLATACVMHVYIVADTLCRCAVYSFLHYAEQPLLSFLSPTKTHTNLVMRFL